VTNPDVTVCRRTRPVIFQETVCREGDAGSARNDRPAALQVLIVDDMVEIRRLVAEFLEARMRCRR
jgi:hypothetical protein